MNRLGLIVVVAAAIAGCASASPYATVTYCTPAGVRTTPTAAVGGLVAAVNALPAAVRTFRTGLRCAQGAGIRSVLQPI